VLHLICFGVFLRELQHKPGENAAILSTGLKFSQDLLFLC
jgi:hypothetical protein